MRLAARSALALAVVLLLATCSSPTEPPTPPGEDPPPLPPGGGPLPPMTALELTLSDSVVVHGLTTDATEGTFTVSRLTQSGDTAYQRRFRYTPRAITARRS